ncbi:MAG TPA: hypothetical protein PKB02_10655 [Anaerohalosphaeraceae bacterium]|nr:hypothetical protein [Anaerohalosphaeraceae bacterium]
MTQKTQPQQPASQYMSAIIAEIEQRLDSFSKQTHAVCVRIDGEIVAIDEQRKTHSQKAAGLAEDLRRLNADLAEAQARGDEKTRIRLMEQIAGKTAEKEELGTFTPDLKKLEQIRAELPAVSEIPGIKRSLERMETLAKHWRLHFYSTATMLSDYRRRTC